jgi:two-component system sensor histidine kinase AtoS
MNDQASTLLKMKGIYAGYGSVKAVDGVDFDLFEGEIHALVGEHRAGKTTLVNILSGAIRKDHGDIWIGGKPVDHFTPQAAIKHGIGIIYQTPNFIPSLNAIENIYSGRIRVGWLSRSAYSRLEENTIGLSKRYGLAFNLRLPLERLSLAEKQMVELARVLSINPQIVIFDEVSSRFNPEEMEIVYKILFEFRSHRKGIIYISHNMEEIFRFADRVTVLQNGHTKGTDKIKNLDQVKLIKMTYSHILSREELERNNLELYYIMKYNETIIKNLPIGFIVFNTSGRSTFINYAALEIFDCTIADSLNKPLEYFMSETNSPIIQEIKNRIQNRETSLLDEVAYKGNIYLRLQILPFKDDEGVFLGSILLIQDITRDKHFEEYFLRAEKIASIAQLAAGVAHEINNPLGIVTNYIELLKYRDIDQECKEKLQKIENELRRISKTVGSLLSFSKSNQIPRNVVDLSDIIEEVVVLLDHRFKEKKISLVQKIATTNTKLLGEADKLTQLFINLLINSIEAVIKDGSIEININRDDDGALYASISDDGYGIPADIAGKVFDPFFTTKASQKNIGLGLTVCQHIAESHNGFITFTSAPAGGACFKVVFLNEVS